MEEDLTRPAKPVLAKPKPVLIVKFTGSRVSLERVSLSMLSKTLEAIGSLSSPIESYTKPSPDEPPDPGTFQLVGAKAGSAIYEFGGRVSGLGRLQLVGRAIERPDEAHGVDFSFDAIQKLSSIANRLRCQIVIAGRADNRLSVLARIGPDTASQLEGALFIRGETSIFGVLKRVGDVTRMSCSIRLPARDKLLYCRVQTGDLSRKLGRCLYEPVVLTGEARWIRSNWTIAGFLVRSMSQPKQGKLLEAFEEVREAGGRAWDDVADPDAFLDHDRGDE